MIKKNIKLFIGIIIGLILGGTVVYAANMIARDITFDNSNSGMNANNVQDAIDELYIKTNEDILDKLNLSSSKVSYSESNGIRISNRNTSLQLTKGSYIVFASYNYTGGSTGTNTIKDDNIRIVLSNASDECTRLSGRRVETYTSPFNNASGNLNLADYSILAAFVCHFDNNINLEISSNHEPPEHQYYDSYLMVQAIKLD